MYVVFSSDFRSQVGLSKMYCAKAAPNADCNRGSAKSSSVAFFKDLFFFVGTMKLAQEEVLPYPLYIVCSFEH